MPIVLDGTNGINTPDLESAGPISGTTGTFSGAVQASGVTTNLYPLVSATAVASTSGTSIDFTGIPSWVKRITVMFNGVSTNAAGNYQFQIGTSSGVQTSGYLCFATYNGASNAGYTGTTGFLLFNDTATDTYTGQIVLSLLDAASGTWVATGSFGMSRLYTMLINGSKTLSGTLDRVRITSAAGTPAFDAGTINIMYEG